MEALHQNLRVCISMHKHVGPGRRIVSEAGTDPDTSTYSYFDAEGSGNFVFVKTRCIYTTSSPVLDELVVCQDQDEPNCNTSHTLAHIHPPYIHTHIYRYTYIYMYIYIYIRTRTCRDSPERGGCLWLWSDWCTDVEDEG